MGGAGCGGKGGILGGEGGHGLSGLVTEGLGARDRGSIRLQWNQVSHLELQRTEAAVHKEGGAVERRERVCKTFRATGGSGEKCKSCVQSIDRHERERREKKKNV